MRWILPEFDTAAADRLAAALRIRPLTARVLAGRGLSDPYAVERFLHPSFDQLHDPGRMAGMAQAVARLRQAIHSREKILIYGDYDVDGTAAVVLLLKAIEMAGGAAGFHVPNRLTDGYGMRTEVIERAAGENVGLIVSVDTGIRAGEVVRAASDRGIDVIVTDHHLPEAELPPAVAVLNPNRPDCRYPEKNLCGAGVAFKLVQALLATMDWAPERTRRTLESFLKLVAIATVADVVPLTGENRVIVKCGLDGLDRVRNAGLRALLDVSGFRSGQRPSARDVAFRVGPRINAAGRMAHAAQVIRMFLTSDEAEARQIAAQLQERNQERQQTEADIVREILEACEAQPVTDTQAALVFSAEGWHRGVVGIVASRLVERFCRPVFVLCEENGLAQGSGRSIAAFHLLDGLEAMADVFTKFGGHRQAAGATLPASRVTEFRERFNAYALTRLTPADFVPQLAVDAVAGFGEVDDLGVEELLGLEPFGCGNPEPVLAVMRAEVAAAPAILKEKHLNVVLRNDGRRLGMKGWNLAARAPELQPGALVDVAFTVQEDAYSAARGYGSWCAILKNFRESARAAAV